MRNPALPPVRDRNEINAPNIEAERALKRPRRRRGLACWMERVVEEDARLARGFDPDRVHDLRTALRRCRSLAEAFRELDPHPDWKRMNRQARDCFRALGDLRESHVMRDWVKQLGLPRHAYGEWLRATLAMRETAAAGVALGALRDFDRRQWNIWRHHLPLRILRVARPRRVFLGLAAQRWEGVRQRLRTARRSGNDRSLHVLRIALKRFRYLLENFLPDLHRRAGEELKRWQDLLGEIHDLDLLAGLSLAPGRGNRTRYPPGGASRGGHGPRGSSPALAGQRSRWLGLVQRERNRRLRKLWRSRDGKSSPVVRWRALLPRERDLDRCGVARLEAWASRVDPDVSHARHVARLSLSLHDLLRRRGKLPFPATSRARAILEAAALCHDCGSARAPASHHKESYRLLRELPAPADWTFREWLMAALVARYHRRSEPRGTHEGFRELGREKREQVRWLAAILRLCDALDTLHDGAVTGLRLAEPNHDLLLYARGLREDTSLAGRLEEKKGPLEKLLEAEVRIKPEEGIRERKKGGIVSRRP